MYKALLVTCFFVSCIGLRAQNTELASSSVAAPVAGESAVSTPVQNQTTSSHSGFFGSGILAARAPSTPVGSFTGSYVYEYVPNYVGADRSLMGWSATPEVNFTKYLGFQAEFTGLYMRGVGIDQNRLMMAAGPRVTLAPHSKITPFIFGEGGEIRATRQLSHASNWNPVATGGIGFDYKIIHGFALQLIPGEYVGQLQDNGTWANGFMTKAGITFNLFK